jgi:tRNA-splicing endonuclease subunit sen54 N-term
MAHVPRELCTGPWFQTIGTGGPTGTWLLPEETLSMVSSGRIELRDEDGLEMGVIAAWGACIEPAGGVNTYLVSKLMRLLWLMKDLFAIAEGRVCCFSARDCCR